MIKIADYVYEPLERKDTYCPIRTLIKLKSKDKPKNGLPFYNSFNVMFRNQFGMDCFQRCVDFIARFTDGNVDLKQPFYVYKITNSKNARVTLPPL